MELGSEDLAYLSALLDSAGQPSGAALTRAERLRQKYRRRYHRRIDKLHRLRDEVSALEATLSALSIQQCGRDGSPSERSLGPAFESSLPTDPGSTREDLVRNLRVSMDVTRALQRERAQLRRQFMESCDHWRRVRDLTVAQDKLYVATPSSIILVKPLTVAECDDICRNGMEARELFLANKTLSELDESLCGWSAHRSVEGSVHKYAFEKTYHNVSRDFCAAIVWRLFSEPDLWRSVYSPSLEMQVRVVQRVDDNNVVMLQEYVETGDEGERFNIKMLHLLTRRWTERGYEQMIFGLSSDRIELLRHPEPRVANERIVWSDQLLMAQAGLKREHTFVHVAGHVPVYGRSSAWLWQLSHILFRWDNVAFGPRFTLPKP